MPAIRALQLSYRYRRWPWSTPRVALRDVSWTVERGTLQLLAGANGAGKSTLLRLLAGVVAPSGGQIELLDLPLGSPQLRGRLAWMPEASDARWRLAVRELLELAAALYGGDGAAQRARVDTALAEALLEPLAKRSFATLSKGERRRVGVAQALATGAELLLLDEPLDGVDPESAELLLESLARRARAGATIVLSSHVLLDGRIGGDGLALLDRGALIASGPPATLLCGPAGERLPFAALLRRARGTG